MPSLWRIHEALVAFAYFPVCDYAEAEGASNQRLLVQGLATEVEHGLGVRTVLSIRLDVYGQELQRALIDVVVSSERVLAEFARSRASGHLHTYSEPESPEPFEEGTPTVIAHRRCGPDAAMRGQEIQDLPARDVESPFAELETQFIVIPSFRSRISRARLRPISEYARRSGTAWVQASQAAMLGITGLI